jgi:NAD+ diphosphatase
MLYEFEHHHIELPGKAPEINSDSRVIIWYQDKVVKNDYDISWSYSEVKNTTEQIEFVGILNGKSYFSALSKNAPGELVSLRDIAFIGETQFMLCSRARAHHDWRQEHRYCGKCGSETTQVQYEFALQCIPCRMRFYPRIAPCIIVVITDGENVLLAQGEKHKEQGWYGAIAGFVESGESAEQAVVREVREEVDISIKNIRYQNSQAWPFPNQLMLGYLADYDSGIIKPAPGEIADAKWFSIYDLPKHPPSISIAGWLIKQYKKQLEEA